MSFKGLSEMYLAIYFLH